MTDLSVDDGLIDTDQAAQEFEIPDRLPAAPIGMFGPPGATSSFGDPRPARRPDAGDIKTLEDLYHAFPELGKGDWKIRIERTAPRSFRGVTTHGFLGEFYEKLSLDEFRTRFGGGSYRVAVMKPVSQGATATMSDYKSVRELALRIAGDPTLEGIHRATQGDDDMAQRYNPNMFGAPSEAVEIKRLELDQRARERDHQERVEAQRRLDEERKHNNTLPEFQQRQLYDTTKRVFEDLKDHTSQQLNFWQGEVERMRGENNFLRDDNKRLTEELTRAQADVSNTNRQIETAAMREMKERYEDRLSEMKDQREEDRRRKEEEFTRKLTDQSADHRRVIEDMTRRYDDERRTYEAAQAMERERTREDTRSRVADIDRQKEQEIATLTRTYEARIADLQRGHESMLNSMRDQTRREVDSIRQSAESSSTLTKETSVQRVTLLEAELNRVRSDNTHLVSENSELRERITKVVLGQVKDPMTALKDAREMATQFGGLVEAADMQDSGEPSWGKVGMSMVEKLMENVPDIIDKINQGRAEQAQRVVVPPMQQQPQQQHVPQPRPLPQRYAPPPMGFTPVQQQPPGYTPPPMGAVAYGPTHDVPLSPAVVQVPSPIQPGGQSTESGPPPMGSGAVEGDAGEGAVVRGPVTVGQSHMAQPHMAQQAPPQHTPLNGNQVAVFLTELEQKFTEGVVSSRLFARGFMDRVGPEATIHLLNQVTPAAVIEWAEMATKGESRLVTRAGQTYVREMFTEVGRLLQQMSAQQQQGGAP